MLFIQSIQSIMVPSSPEEVTSKLSSSVDMIQGLIQEIPVLVFSSASCCICLVVKELFSSLGVHATFFDVDTESEDALETQKILAKLSGRKQPVPLVFIGGKLIGGLDSLLTAHITGKLLKLLKEAKAFS